MDYFGSWFNRLQVFSFCRYLLVPMLFFFRQTDALCQATEVENPVCVINFGVLANYSSVIDQKYSSLSYSGINPGLSARFKIRLPHIEHVFEAVYSGGNLETSSPVSKTLKTTLLNINYYSLVPVYKSGNELFSVQVGAGMGFLYNQRVYSDFINSGRTFETIISLAGTGLVEYTFGSEIHSLRLSDHFTVPFLFYYLQPGYSSLTEPVSETESVKNQDHVVFIPKVLRFSNMVSLEKPLNHSLAVFLFYNWDFYQIKSSREIRNNNQEIGLAVSYKF